MDLQPTVKCSNIKVLYVRTSKIGLVSLYCDSSAWIRDGGIQNIRSMQRHKPHFALTKQRSFSGQKVFFPQTNKTLNIQNCLVLNHEQWMCNHYTWKHYARVSKVQIAMYKKKGKGSTVLQPSVFPCLAIFQIIISSLKCCSGAWEI